MTEECLRQHGDCQTAVARDGARAGTAGRTILLCANTAWSMVRFRRGLLAALIHDGYEVHVVAPGGPDVPALEAMGCHFHALEMSAQGRNPLQDIRLVAALYRIYRRVKPALIIHYTIKPNIYGSMAARLAGIRSIAVTTGLGYVFINHGLVSVVSKLLYRLALRFSGQVWFLNQDDRRAFVSAGLVDDRKCTVLPGEGIDLAYFAPVPPSTEPAPDQYRFLLIARMLWDKGVGEYVEAARALKARHPHVRFQLAGAPGGDSPSAISMSEVEGWVKEGIVEYLGVVKDIRPVIGAAHCIVLPSYREGIPRALLEASAMGRPVVATAVPGCQDVVDNGETGLLCRVRDAADLEAKMEAMVLRAPMDWRRMGQAGRARMEQTFDEKYIIEHYRHVIHALV